MVKEKVIPVKGLEVTVLSTGVVDVIKHVLHCPFSGKDFVMLENDIVEYCWPSGLKHLNNKNDK
mgnify:FL=1|jgi:hypothetical protein